MAEENKKIKGLPTTIIFGVLLLFAVICAIILLQIDVGAAVDDVVSGSASASSASESAMSSSSASAGEQVGEAIGKGIGAVIVGAFLIVIEILLMAASGIPAIVSLPFTIKNAVKLENKPLKIINFVYIGLAAFVIVVIIIKIIQLIML